MKRLLCLQLPHWPIQRLLAERPELRAGPVLLLRRDPRRGAVVVDGCGRVRAAGVRPGTPLAEATGMLPPTTTVHPHDPAADLAALGRLAECCEQFSPRVGWQTVTRRETRDTRQKAARVSCPEPHHLFLDITGIAGLFGGEENLVSRVLAACREQQYAGRVAVAETLGAAWAISGSRRFAEACMTERFCEAPRTGSREVMAVPDGDLLPALRPLPVESLRLPEETVGLLARLGVGTIADLLRLPRAGLAVRFGPSLLLRLDQALGNAPEILIPHRPPPVFEAAEEFDFPTDRRADLDWVLDRLIERVTRELHTQGRGAIRVRVEFRCACHSRRDFSGPLPSCGGRSGGRVSPEGAGQLSPGREPWVNEGRNTLSPEGATQSDCVAPSGLGINGMSETQGSRPGLSCPAPSGLKNDVRIDVALYRPTDLAKPLRELVRLHCDRLELPGPVDRVRLWADQTIPLRPRQENLFADPAAALGGYFSQLVERLSSRLGPTAVLRPVRQADPLPERAVRYVALIRSDTRHETRDTRQKRSSSRVSLSRVSCLDRGPSAAPVRAPGARRGRRGRIPASRPTARRRPPLGPGADRDRLVAGRVGAAGLLPRRDDGRSAVLAVPRPGRRRLVPARSFRLIGSRRFAEASRQERFYEASLNVTAYAELHCKTNLLLPRRGLARRRVGGDGPWPRLPRPGRHRPRQPRRRRAGPRRGEGAGAQADRRGRIAFHGCPAGRRLGDGPAGVRPAVPAHHRRPAAGGEGELRAQRSPIWRRMPRG